MSLLLATALVAAQVIPPVRPPKPPSLPGFPHRVVRVFGPSGLEVSFFSGAQTIRPRRSRFDFGTQPDRRVLLYGLSTPRPGQDGYNQGVNFLERLVGRTADAWLEPEPGDPAKSHRAADVRYVWAWGKLLNFEMVRAGWARLNDEGRKGKYGPLLIAAEDEAKRLRNGMWRDGKP
ncbi:MAG: thermonuclease family protein [Fimbriimonas sp.]